MENREYIVNEIVAHYEHENTYDLAKRLHLSEGCVRQIARRRGIKKGSRTITNAIIDGKKLCPCCSRMLDVDSCFYHDKYAPNNRMYYCIECRKKKALEKAKKTIENTVKAVKETVQEAKVKVSMAFHKRKTRNPIVEINGVKSLRCKECREYKPLDAFYVAKGNISGRMNFCITCFLKKAQEARDKAKKIQSSSNGEISLNSV